MLSLICTLVKYTCLFIGSIYGFFRLAKIKLRPINIIDIPAAVVLATVLYYSTVKFRPLIPLIFLALTCLYTFIRYRKKPIDDVVACTVSCGITVMATAFAFVLSIPFSFLLYKYVSNATVRDVITLLISDAFQLLFVFSIYKIKRFKSGISISDNDGSIDILLLISILSIFFMTFLYADEISNITTQVIFVTFIFCGLTSIILWKKHINDKYKKQIHKRNEEIYEQRITAYEKERDELIKHNAELSKIIHRDNKLIPAITDTVNEIVSDMDGDERLSELSDRLNALYTERNELINSYQNDIDDIPKTDVIALDAALHFIASKAVQNRIVRTVSVGRDCIPPLLDAIPDMTDLTTVICDLGENAVISARGVADGKISIVIKPNSTGSPSVCFYDNGAPFDDKVITAMGRRRITTHKDSGGSGIGLMTMFEILNKYNASYRMSEYPDKSAYSKCVEITFDGKHEFEIVSARNNVKKICQMRGDVDYKKLPIESIEKSDTHCNRTL